MTFFVEFFLLSLTFYPIFAANGILDLHKGDFDKTTQDNQYLLVEFYAPWCGHCQAFEPEFHKTAQLLEQNGSPVQLAKVNVEEEKSVAAQNGIHSYPTIRLFRNGFPVDYRGAKNADNIVNWLQVKTGPVLRSSNQVPYGSMMSR